MGKDLFDWLGERMARWGQKKPTLSGEVNACPAGGEYKGVERLHDIFSRILQRLETVCYGTAPELAAKRMRLYISDSLLFHQFTPSVADRLRQYLEEQRGYAFAAIDTRLGPPDGVPGAVPVTEGVWLSVVEECQETQAPVVRRAVLTVVDGCGTLLGDPVTLDPGNHRYPIGLGEYPEVGGGRIRHNRIAIDDNPELPAFERFNKYVSRTHAHIDYTDKNGFVLVVEPNGTRQRGKRTEVIRHGDGTVLELDSPLVPVPLYDGDCIVLNRAVRLAFAWTQPDGPADGAENVSKDLTQQ